MANVIINRPSEEIRCPKCKTANKLQRIHGYGTVCHACGAQLDDLSEE